MRGALRVWMPTAATLIAALASLVPAHANGDSPLSLHRFTFTTVVEDEQLNFGYRWRVTVCTPAPGRVRIRAVVESLDFATERHRFVRRQPAGCKRHRMRAFAQIPEGETSSMLRVAWKGERARTGWLNSGDPAPD